MVEENLAEPDGDSFKSVMLPLFAIFFPDRTHSTIGRTEVGEDHRSGTRGQALGGGSSSNLANLLKKWMEHIL